MSDTPQNPEDDAVEGHRFSSSDRNIKDDITPVQWQDDDDAVEGHKIYSGSDRNIKDDITPVQWQDDDDAVEGHAMTHKTVGDQQERRPGSR